MKPRPWFFVLPVLALSSLQAQESSDNLRRLIVSLHNRIYGQENLLIKPFSRPPGENDIENWRRLMARARAFVTAKGDRKVNARMMRQLDGASDNLINLRNIYFNVIKVALPPASRADGLARLDGARIDFAKINLAKLKSDLAGATRSDLEALKALRKDAASISKLIGASRTKADLEEGECLSVLDALGSTLEATLDKLNKDAQRLEAAAR